MKENEQHALPAQKNKRLSHPPHAFRRVILYARQHRANQEINETLIRLVDYLKTQSVDIFSDEDTALSFDLAIPTLKRADMDQARDLVIVVGGDGSLLTAARFATKANVPVIGVNRGRLGFLTDLSPYHFETQLAPVLQGKYIEEHRFLLQTRIHDEQTTYFKGAALNDVVLSRGKETHLIEFEVYVDGEFVTHYRSDGLIIATPTGSTAYALSAGGPIMHPGLNAMVIVPMFSHSLSSRPLVIDGEAQIELRISKKHEDDLQISCDSQEYRSVKIDQHVVVEKYPQQLRLLHPCDYTYYDTLRIKLGWGFKPAG